MKKYIFIVGTAFALTACSGGSMVGLGDSEEEFISEYGENQIGEDEDTFMFTYADETGYVAAGFVVDTAAFLQLNFSATDHPERTYEEAMDLIKEHIPADSEELDQRSSEIGEEIDFRSESFVDSPPEEVDEELEAQLFTVHLFSDEDDDSIYTSSLILGTETETAD
ncbi:membrane lipoprotein lipid attachment site-containing protein [Alkalicoccobacillus murimartini]|uniref:DUF5067 domain-containing protein n=1 Tax=Alkalicoccobacillus murimartini TaxID=171685 RepID=A0ABT9YDK5_9BACI|nr:membrane lipoprotein lipid attachment site-containing protein [Alkalicoccobacillus murimartini]MDQ0205708.1 hypothetical protein [Alkalicoccobacillus murimartini]